jgi:hypothetical protein
MFSLNDSMRYLFYNEPTDMRKSYHTLSGLVTNKMGLSVRDGDVFKVYSRSCDENLPVVCIDEKPVQLLAEAREGFTSNSTGIRYEDNEYVRNGTCSIFLFTEPLAGWRHAEAKQQRTRTDWAERIKWLLDE